MNRIVLLLAGIGLSGCSVLDGVFDSEDARICVPEVLRATPGAVTVSVNTVSDDRFLIQYGYRAREGIIQHNTLDVAKAAEGDAYIGKYQVLSGDLVSAASPALNMKCGVMLAPQTDALVLPVHPEPMPMEPNKETLLDRLLSFY